MIASLVMLTQNDVKRKLAYSTISQMGFMMFQIGLGAFAAAMLHIVGHSFYKAHAFLSAGSWVDPKGASGRKAHHAPAASGARIAIASVVGFGLTALAVWVAGVQPDTKPGGWVLVSVLAIAISQGIVVWLLISRRAPYHRRNIALVVLAAGGLSLFYLGGVSLMDHVLAGSIARPLLAVANPRTGPGMALLVMFFAAMSVQLLRPAAAAGPVWTRIYVLLRHGFHIDEVQNRWVRRIWRSAPSDAPNAG
jgi:NAD(P)H-quinone oxidoreductase subunit 5